jgi:N-acyl-D-amino-acid deacylase
MTHVRDESDRSFESLDEELEIARRAGVGVEHSHIKLGTVAVWHRAGEVVARVEAARRAGLDVLADCYPYLAWHSNLKVMVPDRQYESPASVDKALADVGGAAHVRIVRFAAEPADEGRTLAELAAARGETPVETFIHLVRVGDAAGTEPTVVVESMTEADLETFYRQPWVMVASDGGIGARHPRGAGTFPRVLGRFVRERHWLTLVEAVRKMTSLPAHRLGLRDRGVIRPGARADLVLFDPSTVIDRSTYDDPGRLSAGIELVYVNGAPVWKDGAATGRKPGRVLPD